MNFTLALSELTGPTTLGTANYLTTLGLKFANTTGHRGRIKRILLSGFPSGASPQDLQILAKAVVFDNTAAGTFTTVNVSNIAKHDPASIASNVLAIGKEYSIEPTTAKRIVGEGAYNGRSFIPLIILPLDDQSGPIWGMNETLGIMVAMNSGSTAPEVTVTLDWQEGF